jgi:hypothetical protein
MVKPNHIDLDTKTIAKILDPTNSLVLYAKIGQKLYMINTKNTSKPYEEVKQEDILILKNIKELQTLFDKKTSANLQIESKNKDIVQFDSATKKVHIYSKVK